MDKLKPKAILGVKWTTFESITTSIIQVSQLAILTRFLNPADFGLMAIAMVIIGFSQAFMDMGISKAIIYKQSITKTQLSSLYWLNLISGFVLFVIIILISPVIAVFYDTPQLTMIIILVSLSFVIQPFGQQFMILLQKEMRFDIIAKTTVISRVVGFVSAVISALNGFGVYALVVGLLVGMTVRALIFILSGVRYHKPQFYFSLKDIKGFLSFGLFQMGEKSINYFNTQLDTILIGKFVGMEMLGIYNIAKQIVMRPTQIINPIITRVTFPLMAKVQDDVDRLKNIYLKTINHLSSVNFPIFILLIILAEPIVLLLFGKKWLDAVLIIQILSLFALIRSTGNPVGPLLLAKGRADLGFFWNFALLFYVPLWIWFGSRWGIPGICWSLVFMQLSLLLPNWYFLVKKICGAKFFEYHRQIAVPLSLSSFAGIFCLPLIVLSSNNVVQISVVTFMGFLIYLLISSKYNYSFISAIRDFK
jgi:O-antigen/teichoic acid export membrane protein